MMRHILLVVLLAVPLGCAQILYPRTSKVNADGEAIDYFHGKEVEDRFRWMEDAGFAKIDNWIEKQNAHTATYLKTVSAGPPIHERIIEIAKTNPARYDAVAWRGGKLFALKIQPPLPQPILVVMPSPDAPELEKVVVNPNLIESDGTLRIDWFEPSPDGKLVAVSMSEGGTGVGDLSIYPVEEEPSPQKGKKGKKGKRGKKKGKKKKDRAQVADVEETDAQPELKQRDPVDVQIPRVHAPTAGGSLAWTPDSKGFFYTRYPRDGERLENEMLSYQHLYFHQIGTRVSQDKYMLGKELDRIAQIRVRVDDRSGRALATVKVGDNGHVSHYLGTKRGKWHPLTTPEDGVVAVRFAPAGGMYLLSRKGAPRGRILYLPSPKMGVDKARKVIPESSESIVSETLDDEAFIVTDAVLYVTYQLSGPTELRAFNHRGDAMEGPAVGANTAIGQFLQLDDDQILFSVHSYTAPMAWLTYDARVGRDATTERRISTRYGVDFGDIEVSRATVSSEDGAQVPLTLVHRSGMARNGDNPTLLSGFGSFGRSLTPSFDAAARVWFDHGGVLAFAHVRGGGELGDGWHTAGAGKYKPNAVDDFRACADYLVKEGITKSSRLALMGESYGGLLAGAALSQHPDLVGAVVTRGGLFDLLRAEVSPNGPFDVPEFGTPNDESFFEVMMTYSPYQTIEDKTAYPAAFFIAGANDTEISPFHSHKMAARLKAATSSSDPILVKTNLNGGWGDALPYLQRLQEKADIYAFLFDQLGISYVNG